MAGIPVQEEDRLFSWLSLRARSSSTPTEFVDKVLSDLTGADVQVELDIGLESDSVTSSKAFSCSCGSILYEPTTLKDGSSVCQSCWLKPDGNTKLVHEGESTGSESRPSVNVTLAGLVRKYLKDRVRAVELRMRASEVLAAGQEDTALQLYTEALQLAADDPVTRLRRSEALVLKGQLTDALQDANIAMELAPCQSKSKIHYHKGQILDGLRKKEESLASYLICLVIDKEKEKEKAVREHVVKALCQYVSAEDEKQLAEHAFQRLCRILYLTRGELSVKPVSSMINICSSLAREDFDCLLCCKLLYKPITTPCGHMFCQECLNRSLDYRPTCPACRGPLKEYLASVLGRSQPVTVALEIIIKRYFPEEYTIRDEQYRSELRQLAGPPLGSFPIEADIPVLVCAPAFPSVPCPIHIFEPCYRLMLRRCLESNSYQFGVCEHSKETQLVHIGTMLIVRTVEFVADGRSVVDTVGGKRFRVLRYGMLDGYGRAVVRFFSDIKVPPGAELNALQRLCVQVHEATKNWFTSLSNILKNQITGYYGEMPLFDAAANPQAKDDGPDWVWWACAALQRHLGATEILSQTSLKDRLMMLQNLLDKQMNVVGLCRAQ